MNLRFTSGAEKFCKNNSKCHEIKEWKKID